MEPWKVLMLVAGLVIAVALGLSVQNRQRLGDERTSRDEARNQVDKEKTILGQTKQDLENTQKETAALVQESDELKNKLETTQAQITELDLQVKTVNENIASADKKIDSYKGLKVLVGEIDQFEAKLAGVKTEITELETVVTDTRNKLAVEQAKLEDSEHKIKTKEAMDTYRRTGQNWAPINSKVTAAYNDWGFVVIGAGDDQNISNAAILDVTRDGKPVCKLIITEVQLNQAIADIVPNSLVPGQQVQIGDRVSKPAAVSLPN